MDDNKLRILVIDDNPNDVDLLRRKLKGIAEFQMEVFWADNGSDAAGVIRDEPIELVFLDYQLSAETGFEVLEHLREHGEDCPVIALTGHSDARIAADITRAGADGYLQKDHLDRDILRDAIVSALDRCRLRREKQRDIDRKLQQAERLATIGQTIASISHNIKGIMTALKGSSYLIEQALHKKDYGKIDDVWPVYARSTDRLSHLVQQMLNYSKEPELKLLDSDINSIVGPLVDSFQGQAQTIGVKLEWKPGEDIPAVHVDPEAITDALQGIIENALQACSSGSASGSVVKVTTFYAAEKRRAGVHVSDNGPGIPPEVMDRIFDPFYTTKGSRGTGLGLSIAHKVLNALGGSIGFQSRPGRTVFTMMMPTARASEAREREKEAI